MQVIIAPDWRRENPYLGLLAESLRRAGADVGFSDFPRGLFPLLRIRLANARATVLHLHWVNNLIAPVLWPNRAWQRRLKLALLVLDVGVTRALGMRVVWTVHNLVAHEGVASGREIRSRAMLARLASRVIVHSAGALTVLRTEYGANSLPSRKTSIIPHGNYTGCYSPNPRHAEQLRIRWQLRPCDTTILFFGKIMPYKGFERLLSAFAATKRRDARLIIAGQPTTDELRRRLEQAAVDDPRILLALQFIPDEEVAAYFEVCDVVVLAFERTLTSGSAILAMTQGKALILPARARILDLGGIDSILYFEGDEGLSSVLNGMNKEKLREMGIRNYHAARQLDWQSIGEATMKCYLASGRDTIPYDN